ncbi:hypothetical protein C0J52_26577 [Blattella germanica]|nr:hypothetical protein C0J52_26577 [Blattella germanica]
MLSQHLFVMLIPSPINFFKPGFFRKWRLFRKSRGLERSYSFGFLNGESLEDRTYIIRPTVVAIVPSSSSSEAPSRAMALKRDRVTEDWIRSQVTDNITNGLAQRIENFIDTTLVSSVTVPIVLMSNIRNFIDDITKSLKKIAKKSGVTIQHVSTERMLQQLILHPLNDHVKQQIIIQHIRNGSVDSLGDNMRAAASCSMHQFGVGGDIPTLSHESVVNIHRHLLDMQQATTALEKLEHLFESFIIIFQSVSSLMVSNGN